MLKKLGIIRGGNDDSISDLLLSCILEQCFAKDKSYQVTHIDLINKIRQFIGAPVPIQKPLGGLDCSKYIEKIESDAKNLALKYKYIQYYEKPNRGVILHSNPNHKIFVRQDSFRISTTLPDAMRLLFDGNNQIVRYEECKVCYQTYQEKISHLRDFPKIEVETLERAEKFAKNRNIYNADDFDIRPSNEMIN